MKIALVCDDLTQYGGAEKVLLAIAELFPEAPIYTSVFNPKLKEIDPRFSKLDIRTSFMQNTALLRNFPKAFFFLHPFAYESFNFDQYTLVISTSSRFAHGVITKPHTCHISYFYTPARFLWDEEKYLSGIKKSLLAPVISHLKKYDRVASQRPDYVLAISRFTAERIKKIYGREAEVLYPPMDKFTIYNLQFTKKTSNLKQQTSNDQPYFLIVSRLVSWKKVDIAVGAANKLGFNLKIVGEGPDKKRLQKLVYPERSRGVEFLDFVSDEKLAELYQNCQALIMTQEEDFGLTSLEAQSFGKPVIAYRGGGAQETVIESKTGEFFYPQTAEALIGVLQNFNGSGFGPEDCKKNVARFGKEAFGDELKKFVDKKLQEYRKNM